MRRMLSFLIVAIVAIAAATARGQTIDGPDQVDAGKPVWYSITGVPENSQAVWIPNAELQAGLPYICDGHALLFCETPGKRTLTAIVAVLNEQKQLQRLVPLSKTIEVTGEAPPAPFVNPYPAPAENWKAAVKKLLPTSPPRSYASDRSARFQRLAQAVSAGTVTGVADLWKLMAAEQADGSWPATKAAVAQILDMHLGRADVPLDKAEAEQLLMAIAWAIMEASR